MHLGVIPDGNRRYARENGITEKKAYKEARNVIEEIAKNLEGHDIEEATFYLLSEENLNRESEELETLFELLEQNISRVAKIFDRQGFNLNWASTMPKALPEKLRDRLEELEEKFDSGDKTVNLLISYDGKSDILNAAQEINANGGSFDREAMKKHLEIDNDIDYVIRTGDNPERESISGFPIWNSSYAEYYHIKKHFPDVETDDVKEALQHFKDLRRKKGR